MTQEKHTYIENLIKRFFEGETSNKEENELFRFFSENDIPEEWQKYKPVFTYFMKDMETELKELEIDIPEPKTIPAEKKNWKIWVSVAASLILIISVSGSFLKNQSTKHLQDDQNYVIINGEKITDPKVIESEVNQRILEYLIQEYEIYNIVNGNNTIYDNNQWDYIEVTYK